MNLQPMQPHSFTASYHAFDVVCSRCDAVKSSTDVSCDLDAPAGTYYCQHCAVVLAYHARNNP